MPGETHLTVVGTERLGPGMVRVRFSGDLGGFADSTDTDRYVKLTLGNPDAPVVRTYTAVDPDVAAGTVAIDFVVHGDEGVAGPWAVAAKPGDTLTVRGPGGGYAPDPAADWHLLAGDESAIPAIRAALGAIPEGKLAYVVVELPAADHVLDLPTPAGVTLTWAGPGELEATVRGLPWLDGRVQVFVHGEAQVVMHGVRPYLLKERAVPRADASISGYWRRGRTEETFREWKRELAASESA